MVKKIGVFDSGIGGLSIVSSIMYGPFTDIIYIADTAYLPYGDQSTETIIERGRFITSSFINRGITTIIVACHTSSAVALSTLKKEFPHVTFIDMLEPTITGALQTTRTNIVGVLATQATINKHMHKTLLQERNPLVTVIEQACQKLVPLIESDKQQELEAAVKEYSKDMNKIDTLILGCTHYAFIEELLHKQLPTVTIISAQKEAQQMFVSTQKRARITFFETGTPPFIRNISTLLKTPTAEYFRAL